MSIKQPEISAPIRKKLKQARVARLATLDAKGRPHIVPICFAYDGEFFYTAIDEKPKRVAPERLRRVQNIRRTERVALLIDEYTDNWARLWYVFIRGQAKLVPKSAIDERARAIRELKAKYPQYSQGMLADDAPIIRITPETFTSWGQIE